MKIGMYPGSFDPVTNGHIDIIKRATKIVDKLFVCVLENNQKSQLFLPDKRVKMIKDSLSPFEFTKNVEVIAYKGLSVELAKEINANVMFRGLRAVSDFEYELQLAQTNKQLSKDVETMFLTTSLQYSFLSSSLVKEIASYGGDISKFVPDNVQEELVKKMGVKSDEK